MRSDGVIRYNYRMAHIPPRTIGSLRARAGQSFVTRRLTLPAQRYIHTASTGGIVLLAAAIVALIWANSPWADEYHHILEKQLSLDVAAFHLELTVEHWINDGLMAIFFFVVALEIKRELVLGQLSSPRRAALPIIAALGGMVVPAALYLSLNPDGEAARGWGIPMATDIAFALGVLALLGRRIPAELRAFLLGLAVVDDLGAIFVIAVAYTESLDMAQLALVGVLIIVMMVANRVGFRHAAFTIILSFMIWVATLESGIHATVAGVVIGALIPARPNYSREDFGRESEALLAEYGACMEAGDTDRADDILGELELLTQETESQLQRLERLVHPWASYVVLPIFALANAGIAISGDSLRGLAEGNVAIGVALGLLVGKVVGIMLFPWIASRFGIVELPRYVTWTHIFGVGLLGGIGFTVAIFIAGLAFNDPTITDKAKMGILGASALAGLAGYLVLRFTPAMASGAQTDSH